MQFHWENNCSDGVFDQGAGEVVLFYCFNGRYVSQEEPPPGYSALLKARRRSDKEPVAVKVWGKDAPEGRREAEIWRSAFPEYYIESRNEGGKFVLVRRWIEGISLAEYVAGNGVMDPGKAVAICLCTALRLRGFYQVTGMFYGDLRPENVLIGNRMVHLVDFESAGEESSGGSFGKVFKSKTLKFISPGFAAPEVFRGKPCCASDFYALGVLLNYLITGEPSDNAGRLPEGSIKEFVTRCTVKDVNGRFPSIESAATELGNMLRELGEKPFGTLEEEVRFYLGEDMGGPVKENTGAADDDFLNVSGIDQFDPYPKVPEKPGEPEETPADARGEAIDQKDDSGENGEPQDGAFLFPHYERGYRRLILYVPENISFATEMGYVFGTCFGMKTCVLEFVDYAPPRLPYYFTADPSESVEEGDVRAEPRSYDCFDYDKSGCMVSEDGPSYGAGGEAEQEEKHEDFHVQEFTKDWFADDFVIETSRALECGKVSFGAGSFDQLGFADDDFMRGFMGRAYSDYDVTILCDNMFEHRGNSLQLMRYCDYLILTVSDEADEFETVTSRYTRLLRENRISRSRLKVVCWEKSRTGAGPELLKVPEAGYDFAGSVGYDDDRHYVKNVAGDVYCRQMKGEIIAQYCEIASRLAYGDRSCA